MTSSGIWMSKKKRTRSTHRRVEPAPTPVAASEGEAVASRWIALVIPVGTASIAFAIGVATSAAPAILVLVGGAILGAVLLFWASVRSLTGDAPLAEGLATAAIETKLSEAHERKKRALRALKDLENERALGKLDEEDYAVLAAQYRDEAKDAMRALDTEIAPRREKAEEIIRAHLARRRVSSEVTEDEARACPSCETTNDADAAFCKKCGAKLDDAA